MLANIPKENLETLDSIDITLNISDYERYLLKNKENIISVQAGNLENNIQSRSVMERILPPKIDKDTIVPDIYLVCIGVSDYNGQAIDLSYADKDAEDIMGALYIAAGRFLGKEKVHSYLLTNPKSGSTDYTKVSTASKDTILAVLNHIEAKAKAEDIVIIYFSGHGLKITSEDKTSDFYYLTAEADSNEPDAYTKWPSFRNKKTIKGAEISAILNKIPANKQVLIIDACHSGKIVDNFSASRNLSPSTMRALSRMQDRTGIHIISGSSADKSSYESSQYAQGFLTYSLLEGIKGNALRESQFIDISTLFAYAEDRVPELAKENGGIQKPLRYSPYYEERFPNGGMSFDVGQLTPEDRAKIKISQAKPVFLMSNIRKQGANPYDELRLNLKIDEQFRELTAKGKAAPLVFWENVRELDNAYTLYGEYSLDNENILFTGNIIKNGKVIYTFQTNSSKDQLDIFIEEITREIIKALENED